MNTELYGLSLRSAPIPLDKSMHSSMTVRAIIEVPSNNTNFWIKGISIIMKPRPMNTAKMGWNPDVASILALFLLAFNIRRTDSAAEIPSTFKQP